VIWHWAENWLLLELAFKFRRNLGKGSGTASSILQAAQARGLALKRFSLRASAAGEAVFYR